MRQGVYGFVLGAVVGGAMATALALPGDDLRPPATDSVAGAGLPPKSSYPASRDSGSVRAAIDTASLDRVPVDTVSPDEVAAIEASVSERDQRIVELKQKIAQLQQVNLAAKFAGVTHVDGDTVELSRINSLLSEVAEGDKFVTLPEVENLIRSIGPQNTFHAMTIAESAMRNLLQTRSNHKLNHTDAEHRAWRQHNWPSVLEEELRLDLESLHRLGVPGCAVESLRQKARKALLR